MNWNDRIRKVRKERRMRREDVVETMRAYLPDGETVSTRTLASWELGDSEPKISHAIALAKTYQIENVTELFFDDPAEAALTPEGRELLRKYRELLLESPRYTHRRPHLKPVRQLPLYDLPVSAGTGNFLDSDCYEMVDADDSIPLSADFALTILGNSMSPTLKNGQIVWVCQQNTLEPGEIGIFCLNGQAFCKELAQDEKGVFLYSHNPAYTPIRVTEYDELLVFGKVVG